MLTTKEIRLANLQALVAEFESIQRVSTLADSSRVYLCQILLGVASSTGTARGVGDGLARRLEHGCGKPRGWMDYPHGQEDAGRAARKNGTTLAKPRRK